MFSGRKKSISNFDKRNDASELKLLTKKHSHSSKNRSLGRSGKVKDVITFTTSIDLVDGIIVTNTGRKMLTENERSPIFAVISYSKKVVSSGKIVKTNLMSMPLRKSASSFGNRERYFAQFTDGDGPQSFVMSAMMQQDPRFISGYQPRELDFEISLMKGGEVVKLGTSTLVLNGDEDGSTKILPVCSSKAVTNTVRKTMTANKPSKTSVSSFSSKGMKMVSFSGDSSRKYSVQRATCRVSVNILQESKSNQSLLLENNDTLPHSMILSIDKSDSVSVLSLGGVTSNMYLKSNEQRSEDNSANKLGKKKSGHLDVDVSLTITEASTESEVTDGKSLISTPNFSDMARPCTEFNFFKLQPQESDDSSDVDFFNRYNFEKSHKLHVPRSFSYSGSNDSDEQEETSFDESSILDEVSLGTIKYKGFESTQGFEVISTERKDWFYA